MATITTRAGKGSPLTNAEVDANFNNLNNDKAENGSNADITALTAIAAGISSPDYVDFNTAATVTRSTGRLNWNSTDGCLEVGLVGSEVTQQIGQEMVSYAYNSEASTINNGELVYFFSNSNGNPAVKKFIADRTLDSELVLGVATEDISAASKGYVTEFGIVRDIDTSAFSIGDVLYADASTPGAITNVKPVSPNAVVVVGICLEPNVTNGTIFVKPHKIPDADDIFYDNNESGMTATNVKGAIDELQLNKADISLLNAEINLYATSAASDIATYNKLVTTVTDTDFDDPAVNVSTGELTTAETLIASLASVAGLVEGDLAGTTVTTIGNVRRTAGNNAGRFWFEVYHRTSGGTETLIGTGSKTEYTEAESYTQFFDSALLQSQEFTSTDRIVLKFYGQTDAGTATFDFQFGGTQPIRTLFPVPAALIPTTTVAGSVTTDTGSFNGKLSGSDTTVQAALDTLDDHTHSISEVTNLQTTLDAKALANEFTVTPNGSSAYTFDGTGTDSDDNPTLYLQRGMTYEFNVNASGHPFYIKTVAGTGTGDQYTDNVTNNGVEVGTLTFEVQMDAPDTLYYQCSVHAAMVGTIIIQDRDDNLKAFADTFTLPESDGTDGQVLTTDGAGNLVLEAIPQTGVSSFNTRDGAVTLTSGDVTDALTFTPADVAGDTFTGNVIINSTTSLNEVIEKCTIDNSTSNTFNFDALTQAVIFLDTDQTANRTINFRGDVTTSLDSIMATGESMTFAVLATQGATPYYFNGVRIDGSDVTPKWQGGTAPTAGNASGIDSYSFTIIKTGSATFTVLASQTQFA